MEVSFIPSPDVALILNALLDILERRPSRNLALSEAEGTYNVIHATQHTNGTRNISSRSEAEWTQHTTRSIKIILVNIPLPHYFSQTDPTPRLIANEQLILLEKNGDIKLTWLPGEKNHILQSITLPKTEHATRITQTEHATRTTQTEHATRITQTEHDTRTTQTEHATRTTQTEHDTRTTQTEHATRTTLYTLLSRTPLATNRSRLESLLLADKFRFQDDWRARALSYILNQIKAEKSPAPFSLTDSNLTLDLLTVLQALPTLTNETPYRVFSVRVFNDSKRLEVIKNQLISLARLGNPEWKRISNEEILRELNLVANPNYIHFAGNWQLTTNEGEILNLSGFTPSVGFPAAQTATLQAVRAESVLCIENLTTFHQFTRQIQNAEHVNNGTRNISSRSEAERTEHATRTTHHALLCTYGNPSPAVRRVLRLLPETTPIFLWSDMDYGGFNILAQLRKQISPYIQPYLMDIATFEKHAHLSRPLTQSDARNLKRLTLNPSLKDVHPTIEHILKRRLKLEQEAIQLSTT